MIARAALDSSTVEVQHELASVARLVDEALEIGAIALLNLDTTMARQISAADAVINLGRLRIEERCYALLRANDLSEADTRMLVGVIIVATNLERIADHVAGIAHLIIRQAAEPLNSIPAVVLEMADVARELVAFAVDAFLTRNDQLAESTARRGREIDDLQERLYRLNTSPELLLIVRNVERIGDRAANICERAIYVTTGEMKEFR